MSMEVIKDGKVQFTQKSVFEAAGEMSKLQTETNNSLENALENELTIMKTQLEALQGIEQFWEQFGPAWEEFEEDPSNSQAFEEVIHALEAEYGKDPTLKVDLKLLEQQGIDNDTSEKSWKSKSGWYHFWHGEPLSDPHYFKDFAQSVNGMLQSTAEEVVGNSGLFATALLNGESTFQSRSKQLFETIAIMMDIVKILEGSEENPQAAMFDMEALLMDLEQLQIDTNTQKSQQQQQISQETAQNMQDNLKKIQDALETAAEYSSGGLFEWAKDFFTSIGTLFEDMGQAVYYALSGNEKKAIDAFDDLTKGCKILGQAVVAIFNGDFKQGFEELFTAALFTMLLGPMGIFLLGTKFGEDMKDLATLVTDVVQSFTQLLAAGALASFGDKVDASYLMESNKKLGAEMLANSALKVLGDVAMVAITFAAAVAGQYWLAGLILAFFVTSESGLTQKMTDAVASSIESAMGGKNSALAKILADVTMIVLITALSAGAGAAEATLATTVDSVTIVGEEEEIEMFETAGRQVADEPVDGGSKAANSAAKETDTKQALSGVQIAKRATSIGVYGFGSSLGSSTLATDILKDTSKKDSKLLAVILELVQVIVAAVTASIGGFSTMTQSIGNATRATETTASQLTRFASRMQVAATGVATVSGTAQGGEVIVQGDTQEKLAKCQANVQLDEATQNVTDQMIKQTGEELEQLIKGYEELIATEFKTPAEAANAELRALIQG